MKRIRSIYMHSGCYETEDSDSLLFQKEADNEGLDLKDLIEENILTI